MKKVKLSELKKMVKYGAAAEITEAAEIPRRYDKIAYSAGINGINGGLIQAENGKYYAVTARNGLLFRIF